MAEAAVMKKAGASRKGAAPTAAAPLLLKDGKTPASESALARALGKFGLPVPATLEEKLVAVRGYITQCFEETPHSCTADCDLEGSQCPRVVCECKEVSTYETDFCPFCGDLGLPRGTAIITTPPATMPEPVVAAEPYDEEPLPPSDVPVPDGDDSDAQPVVADPVVEVLPPVSGGDKTADLDAAVRRIQVLKNDWAQNTYDLALELKRVQDDELFKVRGFENFGAWAVAEVGLSRSLAYELAKVPREFDRNTYLEVGSTKMRLIAGIEDPAVQKKALEDAKAGASKRELERTYTTRTVTREAPVKESGKGKAAPAPEPTKPRDAPKKGTEIHLLLKLNGKAMLHPFVSVKTGREIKTFAEDSYVELRLSDNVVLHLAPKFGADGKTMVGITVKPVETEPS